MITQQQHQALSSSDPFDGSNEPILYTSDNRTPVTVELFSALIYIILIALLLALVFILPGVRRKKATSFLGLVTLFMVGAAILLALEGSHWLTGQLHIHEALYGALTSDTITGKLEVNIGLSSTNVTLYGHLMGRSRLNQAQDYNHSGMSSGGQVDYNERFRWDEPERMLDEHHAALQRGLPYPILTITEFLSQDAEGFDWMRQLRQAGYYTSLALYLALASWCLTMVILCLMPIYLPHMMQITGALVMASVWVYTLLIQSPKSFVIQLGPAPMEFVFGHTYVITFMSGVLSMFAGAIMFVLVQISSSKQDQITFLDCEDYLKNQQALAGSLSAGDSPASSSTRRQLRVPPAQHGANKLAGNPFGGLLSVRRDFKGVIIPIGDIEEKFARSSVSASNSDAKEAHC